MSKLIIATAGEMGCGKGTAVKYLVEKYGASSHRYSTMLRDVLDRLYIIQSRDNMSVLSKILRENFGEDIMEKTMLADIQKDEHEIVVLDGARRIEDIQELQKIPEFKLIYIEADIEKRYERVVLRCENDGDGKKTFEKFKQEHNANADATIPNLKQYADYVIDNNGTQEELQKQIDEIIKKEI